MIISHTHKFIFYAAPKTGSESMRAVLEPFSEERILPYRQTSSQNPFYPHMPPHLVKEAFQRRGLDHASYRGITCIRDPFERLVSLYRMIKDVDRLWHLRGKLGVGVPTFKAWVRKTESSGKGGQGWRHQKWRQYGTWSAKNWCSDHDGSALVTHLVPTCDMNKTAPKAFENLGIPFAKNIPRLNDRKPLDHMDWYDPELVSWVTDRYHWDIAYLNKSRRTGCTRFNQD